MAAPTRITVEVDDVKLRFTQQADPWVWTLEVKHGREWVTIEMPRENLRTGSDVLWEVARLTAVPPDEGP